MDEEGGFEVFGFAGGVGHAEEWVDGVAAAAVDDGAGGAEESSAEGGVGVGGSDGRGGRRTRFGGVGRRGWCLEWLDDGCSRMIVCGVRRSGGGGDWGTPVLRREQLRLARGQLAACSDCAGDEGR